MAVTALYRYPVKSMLGESLSTATIGGGGVLGDRAYAVIDVETGAVASAKVPKRWATLLDFSARYVTEPVGGRPAPPLDITFPDGSVLRSDDPGVDDALSTVFARPVRLASTRPESSGFEELWPDIDGLAPQGLIDGTRVRREDTGEAISRFDVAGLAPGSTGFFDLAVLHVLTEATLDRLRELAPGATFDVRRYRPNLVLDGDDGGFVENSWPGRAITVGTGTQLKVSITAMRCVMTTLAQGDLPDDADTLRTIAKHNRLEIPGMGVWACAGVYADVTAGGSVSVGDAYVVS